MAGRYPSAPDLDALWQVLSTPTPIVGPPPLDREGLTASTERWSIGAGFLEEIYRFDAAVFGISPKDAKAMDPQQRLLLQVASLAIENAGYTRDTLPRRTGVFVGIISGDYGTFAEPIALGGELPSRGTDHYQVANRLSYHFDLSGPSIAVDTACSGSGVAFHQAMLALHADDCDVAIVGGVNLFLHGSRFVQFRQMGIISDDNRCRPFRAGANGTVYGEGIGAVLLKRAEEAVLDRDNIRGFLRGTAVNSGGKTQGFTVPSAQAQTEVIRTALARADMSAETIDFVEAHGTGTALGDPIEVRGLKDAFRADGVGPDSTPVSLGSVKGHIGHLESAAAVAGVARIILQMEKGTLLQSLPVGATNPLIDFTKTPFAVQDTIVDLPPARSGAGHRALLSSFGAGGANACLVIEAADRSDSGGEAAVPDLFVLSAHTPEALRDMARNLRDWLEGPDVIPCPHRIAHTLQCGRAALAHRLAILADGPVPLVESLSRYLDGRMDRNTFSGARVDNLSEVFSRPGAGSSVVAELLAGGSTRELAALWVNGVDLDWTAGRNRRELPIILPLPGYPFAGDVHRLEHVPAPATEPTTREGFTGRACRTAFTEQVVYRTLLSESAMPTLSHHRIFGRVIVPGSYFVALAASVGRDLLGRYGFELRDGEFLDGLVCETRRGHEMQCLVDAPGADGGRTVRIASHEAEGEADWRLHFRTTLVPSTDRPPASAVLPIADARSVSPDDFYAAGLDLGFGWTGPFRAIRQLECGAGEAVADIDIGCDPEADARSATIHPAALDAAFQVALAAVGLDAAGAGEAFMPVGLGRIRVHGDAPSRVRSRFKVVSGGGERSTAFDGRIDADDGACVLEFKDLTVLRVDPSAIDRLAHRGGGHSEGHDLLRPEWIADASTYEAGTSPVFVDPLNRSGLLTALATSGAIRLDVARSVGGDQAANLLFAVADDEVETSASARIARAGSQLVDALRERLDKGVDARLWLLHGGGYSAIDSAAMSGLWRSLAWEFPALQPTSVELVDPPNEANAALLADLIRRAPDEDQFRLAQDGFAVRRLVRRGETPVERSTPLAGSQCVVAGGGGGIGALHVEWLLNSGVERVVVLGRSGTSDTLPETLASLGEAWPGKLVYRVADLADDAQVELAVTATRDAELPLAAVIHAAGTIDDGAFTSLDEQRFETVLSVKLEGLRNLVAATAGAAGRYIVLSSATGLLGAPGQANYAAASIALDALCERLRGDGLPVMNVDWGPWKDTGMTARMSGGGAARATSGAQAGFDPCEANELFTRLYANEDGQYVVLPRGWRRFAERRGSQRLPSVWRSASGETGDGLAVDAAGSAAEVTIETDPEKAVAAAIRTVLGYGDAGSFDWNASFADLGVDSLSAISLRDYLRAATGINLNTAVVFDFPTPNRLVDHLRSSIASPRAQSPAPAAKSVSVSELNDAEVTDALVKELHDLTTHAHGGAA